MIELEEETIEKLRKKSIKSILDVILLAEIKNNVLSGYAAISFIHKEYEVLLSSGTVYSHLYALEREGLVRGDYYHKTRIFMITEKGENILEKALKENVNLLNRLSNVMTT